MFGRKARRIVELEQEVSNKKLEIKALEHDLNMVQTENDELCTAMNELRAKMAPAKKKAAKRKKK